MPCTTRKALACAMVVGGVFGEWAAMGWGLSHREDASPVLLLRGGASGALFGALIGFAIRWAIPCANRR